MARMEGDLSGEENAKLYIHGANEGYRGQQPDPSALIELLDVFGEDGLRSYPVGFAEGREDAREGGRSCGACCAATGRSGARASAAWTPHIHLRA